MRRLSEIGERWPGLDIRADGGYVVFAGRTNRGEYRWFCDPEPYPLDILPTDLREFLCLLRPPGSMPFRPPTNGKVYSMPSNGRVDAERLNKWNRRPPNGKRWAAIQPIASSMCKARSTKLNAASAAHRATACFRNRR